MLEDAAKCVLLADRHLGLTEGVKGLLDSLFESVVIVADAHSLQETARRLQPEVAVVDLSLARKPGLHWLTNLRAACPGLTVIAVSVHDEPRVRRAVMASGADGFVVKRALATDLLPTIEALLEGVTEPSREGNRK